MVCPVCVGSAGVAVACKFFGVPDAITFFLVGIFTCSVAYAFNIYMFKKGMHKKISRRFPYISDNDILTRLTRWLFDPMNPTHSAWLFVLIFALLTIWSFVLLGWC